MKLKHFSIALLLCSMMLLAVGCRPYAAPILTEVSPSETAFVIPLDEDTASQQKLNSLALIANKQVAAKRIEIPQRFRQTGRLWFEGQVIPTMRVIKVERKPVTREWKAIEAEDKGSIGFSVEMTLVASIPEDQAASYLYKYSTKSLEDVADQEIQSMVVGSFVEQCALYPLKDLFTSKGKIMTVVRTRVKDYFIKFGIDITNLDLKGNFTFESPIVQEAIDATYVAEQKKLAQVDLNITAKLKAQADKEVAAQLSGPIVLKLKELDLRKIELENQRAWIDAWGKGGAQVPQFITGSQAGNFLMQLPTPAKK